MTMRYGFAAKEEYRVRRERSINKFSGVPVPVRRVAYLDTADALDTMFRLSQGYRPENLWAINRNAAEVANLTRRLRANGLPHVNTIGLDMADAAARRLPTKLDVLDYDGMSNLHCNAVNMIRELLVRVGRGVFAITLLAARETCDDMLGATLRVLERDEFASLNVNTVCHTSFGTSSELTAAHFRRLRLALFNAGLSRNHQCKVHMVDLQWDHYVSASRQPMVWGVVRVEPHDQDKAGEYIRRLNTDRLARMPKMSRSLARMIKFGILPSCALREAPSSEEHGSDFIAAVMDAWHPSRVWENTLDRLGERAHAAEEAGDTAERDRLHEEWMRVCRRGRRQPVSPFGEERQT